jgi:hypothetical protein
MQAWAEAVTHEERAVRRRKLWMKSSPFDGLSPMTTQKIQRREQEVVKLE